MSKTLPIINAFVAAQNTRAPSPTGGSHSTSSSTKASSATIVSPNAHTRGRPTTYSSTGGLSPNLQSSSSSSSSSTCSSSSPITKPSDGPAKPSRQTVQALAAKFQQQPQPGSFSTTSPSKPHTQLAPAQHMTSMSSSSSPTTTLLPMLTKFSIPLCDYSLLSSHVGTPDYDQDVYDVSAAHIASVLRNIQGTTLETNRAIVTNSLPLHPDDINTLNKLLDTSLKGIVHEVYIYHEDYDGLGNGGRSGNLPVVQSNFFGGVLLILKEHMNHGGTLPTAIFTSLNNILCDHHNNIVFPCDGQSYTPQSLALMVSTLAARKGHIIPNELLTSSTQYPQDVQSYLLSLTVAESKKQDLPGECKTLLGSAKTAPIVISTPGMVKRINSALSDVKVEHVAAEHEIGLSNMSQLSTCFTAVGAKRQLTASNLECLTQQIEHLASLLDRPEYDANTIALTETTLSAVKSSIILPRDFKYTIGDTLGFIFSAIRMHVEDSRGLQPILSQRTVDATLNVAQHGQLSDNDRGLALIMFRNCRIPFDTVSDTKEQIEKIVENPMFSTSFATFFRGGGGHTRFLGEIINGIFDRTYKSSLV